jgi:hypothetical protein
VRWVTGISQSLTRTSARGRHRHLLLRNIVGPVTRLHGGRLRGSDGGSDDGVCLHDGCASARWWKGALGDATKVPHLELRPIRASPIAMAGLMQAGNPAKPPQHAGPSSLVV